jgi:mannosyltransferase OCH1-like enzyme
MTELRGEEWRYMFWTDASALSFIKTHYPSYLALYTSYNHNIQRADALRYFLLHHYGGVYLDMDIAPYRRLDALLTLPAFARETTPTGISNDALGSVKGHPFYRFVIENLEVYNRDWGSPYVTVMASTGPLFLSLVLQKCENLRRHSPAIEVWGRGRGAVLAEGRHGGDTEMGNVVVLELKEDVTGFDFFWNVEGRSWQGSDEKVVEWFERHWCVSIVIAVGAVVVVWEGVWRILCWGGRRVRRGVRGMGRIGRRWDIPSL